MYLLFAPTVLSFIAILVISLHSNFSATGPTCNRSVEPA